MTTLPLSPDELLTTTRTVRKRLDLTREVPMQLVRESIDVALQAPSGSNKQGWHWLVVTDADQRAAIARLYAEVGERYFASNASAAGQFTDDPARAKVQQRVGDSARWLAEHIAEVPVHVIPCIEAESLPAGNQAGLWGSLLPAAWSYCLAARARGLGTAWTSFTLAREPQMADILGLPDHVRHGALLPTAYYTGETFKPAARQPVDEVLHLDRW
jgi:nitroreductase